MIRSSKGYNCARTTVAVIMLLIERAMGKLWEQNDMFGKRIENQTFNVVLTHPSGCRSASYFMWLMIQDWWAK